MRKFFIMASALSLLATAGLLDSARADDNPYHPTPAASTETSDHGQGTYCRIGLSIPGWTCDQALSASGGPGNTDNNKATLTPDTPHTPPSPPCDHGPKGDV